MFLTCILFCPPANADWNDITILQDAEISEGDQYVQVFVYSPDAVTTVYVTGGKIGTLFAYDDSVINVTGGIFSPEFYTYHPENNDGDDLMLAPHHYRIFLEDSSVMNYYGADLQGDIQSAVLCTDQSTMNIYAGTVSLAVASNTQVNIFGGEIAGIASMRPFDPVQFLSKISIRGGVFSGKVLLWHGTTADIYGYGFEYDPDGWEIEYPWGRKSEGGRLQGFWADGTAFSMDFSRFGFNDSYSHVVLHEVPRKVQIDIKPQSCLNIMNPKSKGVFDVAILGAGNFDVLNIDVATLSLEGVAPLRSRYKDDAAPLINGQECECESKKKDGIVDLTMKFDTEQVIETLGEVEDGQEWLLHLGGSLYDGTAIEGTDCILIKMN
jgi:hypothetical protein